MPHEAVQAILQIACFGQAGEGDAACVGANGIQTSSKLNKMVVNFFTIESDFSRNNAGCDYFFAAASASLIFFMYWPAFCMKTGLQFAQHILISCPWYTNT